MRLRLDLLRADVSHLTMVVSTKADHARCPLCDQPSTQVHSRYHRSLADLPWNGIAVRLDLTTRRFFCRVADCPRRIFTERLPELVAPYARRTLRLTQVLEVIGLAIGGEAGARVLRRLATVTSPDTLLRVLRAIGSRSQSTPRVLGVDDFAFRRGHRYGTILVDLERHQVIDLLPDRTPETVLAWLEAHGQPEIISRDRGGGYAEAGRRGAPEAIQVADRFHLLQGLSDALEKVFLHHRSALKAAAVEPSPPVEQEEEIYRGKREVSRAGQQRADTVSQERQGEKVDRYHQVRTLYELGVGITEIARQVGVSRKTVYADLHRDGPPERKRPHRDPGERVVAPYEQYLVQRWNEGCHNGMQLWREIQAQGYTASRASVARFVTHLRQYGRPPHPLTARRSGVCSARGPTARQVTLLCLQRPERLDHEEATYLARLRAQDDQLESACQLGHDFVQMVRERQGDRLDSWITQATESGIDDLTRFAAGLRADEAAVRAGLTLEWSQGQVEGHVNRLKVLKRLMYGRANFDLLRQRVLHAA
jgi:transposase